MAKRKSIMFECQNCLSKVRWMVGLNRINQNKVTPCPACGKKPTPAQIKRILNKKPWTK